MEKAEFSRGDPLKATLHEWKVATPLPPGFQNEVWRRIDQLEAKRAGNISWSSALIRFLTRPALATSYLLALLLLGIGTGLWQARTANAHAEEELSRIYVQSVNPYGSAHH